MSKQAVLLIRRLSLLIITLFLLASSGVYAQGSFFALERITAGNAARLEVVAALGIGELRGVSWSPDGRILAATNSRGNTLLYDVFSEKASLHAPVHFLGGIQGVGLGYYADPVFSPDGTRIATDSRFFGMVQTDLTTGETDWFEGLSARPVLNEDRTAIVELSAPDYLLPGTPALLSDDWNRALVMNSQGASLVDLRSVTRVATLDVLGGNKLKFSPDGKVLASTAVYTAEVFLSNMETGRNYAVLNPRSVGTDIDFSPDGTVLATAGGNAIELWDVATGGRLNTLEAPASNALGVVAFSPNGELLAVSGCDLYERGACHKTSILLWDMATMRIQSVFEGPTSLAITDLAFSPDGMKLASASRDGAARIWDVHTGQHYNVMQGPYLNIGTVTFSPDGTLVASPGDETIWLWDASDGGSLEPIREVDTIFTDASFSADSTKLAASTCEMALWDAHTREKLALVPTETCVRYVEYSPDGKTIAFTTSQSYGSADSAEFSVNLWDTQAGEITAAFQGHTARVNDLAFSPDSNWLASASGDPYHADYTVRLWDVQARTDQSQHVLMGHTGPVTSVAFSPDGRQLISSSYDGTIRLWDATTGENTAVWQGQNASTVTFDPSGSLVIGVAERIEVWEAATGNKIASISPWDALMTLPDEIPAEVFPEQPLDYGSYQNRVLAMNPGGNMVAVVSGVGGSGGSILLLGVPKDSQTMNTRDTQNLEMPFVPTQGCIDYADAFSLNEFSVGREGFVINDTDLMSDPVADRTLTTIVGSVAEDEHFVIANGPACSSYQVLWEIELPDRRRGWVLDQAVSDLAPVRTGTPTYVLNPDGITARYPGSTYYAPGTYPNIDQISRQVGPLQVAQQLVNLSDIAVFVIEGPNGLADIICTAVSASGLLGDEIGSPSTEVACAVVDASQIVLGASPAAPYFLFAAILSNPDTFIDPWLNKVNEFAWSFPISCFLLGPEAIHCRHNGPLGSESIPQANVRQVFGPDAIWDVPNEFSDRFVGCWENQSLSAECISTAMHDLGASPQAVEFAELLSGEGVMLRFAELGRVDVAEVLYLGRANDNVQSVLVNGVPVIVHAEEVLDIEITRDPNYQALATRFPDVMLRPTDSQFENMELLSPGGQRFIFKYLLYDGCHACDTVGYVRIAFDFDGNGRFLGKQLLSVAADEGQLPPQLTPQNQLAVGGQAIVVAVSDTLNVRRGAGTDFEILTRLRPGAKVAILDGPVPGGSYIWWKIRTPDGTEGWSVEAVDELQTLVPVFAEGSVSRVVLTGLWYQFDPRNPELGGVSDILFEENGSASMTAPPIFDVKGTYSFTAANTVVIEWVTTCVEEFVGAEGVCQESEVVVTGIVIDDTLIMIYPDGTVSHYMKDAQSSTSFSSSATPPGRELSVGVPAIGNRRVPPTNSALLTGGIGLTQPDAQLGPGEFQVEGFCSLAGFTGVERDEIDWYCTRQSGLMRLEANHFDQICQLTYRNDQAFAIQDGTNETPAFNWRCYGYNVVQGE